MRFISQIQSIFLLQKCVVRIQLEGCCIYNAIENSVGLQIIPGLGRKDRAKPPGVYAICITEPYFLLFYCFNIRVGFNLVVGAHVGQGVWHEHDVHDVRYLSDVRRANKIHRLKNINQTNLPCSSERLQDIKPLIRMTLEIQKLENNKGKYGEQNHGQLLKQNGWQ